jgi:hypothetical protein
MGQLENALIVLVSGALAARSAVDASSFGHITARRAAGYIVTFITTVLTDFRVVTPRSLL